MAKRRKLGELLVEAGVIDELQLQAALGHQRQWGMALGRALVEKRLCSEQQIVDALARQTGLPKMELELARLDRNMAEWVPQKLAEQYRLVPLRLEGARREALVVALGGAPDLEKLDMVRVVARKTRIVVYLARDTQVDRAIDVLYRGVEPPPDEPAPPPAHLPPEVEFDLGAAGDSDPIPTVEELARILPGYEAALLPEPPRRPGATYDDATPLPFPLPPPPAPAAAPGTRAVLIYGWPAKSASVLVSTLGASGIPARIAASQAELSAGAADVIVAPLPAMEALVAAGARPEGSVIVAVKSPESDLPRAQRVGARGYLATPVDSDLLIRAVRRCLARPEAR